MERRKRLYPQHQILEVNAHEGSQEGSGPTCSWKSFGDLLDLLTPKLRWTGYLVCCLFPRNGCKQTSMLRLVLGGQMKRRTGETVALSVNSFWGSKKGDMGSKLQAKA